MNSSNILCQCKWMGLGKLGSFLSWLYEIDELKNLQVKSYTLMGLVFEFEACACVAI